MGYFRGLAAAPDQQQAAPSIPNAPTGVVSGGGMQGPSNATNGTFGLSQAPNAVLNNINAYNGGQYGTMARAGNEQQGLNNYLQQAQQHGQDPGVYTPWAFQDKAAGGYGSNGYDVGNLYGVGGVGGPGQIQAGSNYTFGQNGGQIMQSQYFRNPYTGQIENTGAAQSFANPYAMQYGMNKKAASIAQTAGGLGNQQQRQGLIDSTNSMSSDYYNNVNSNIGQGQFDTRNFDQSMTMNPIHYGKLGMWEHGPDYMGVQQNNRQPYSGPNYMGV